MTKQTKTTTEDCLDKARRLPGWSAAVDWLAAERGLTVEQLEEGLQRTPVWFAPFIPEDQPRQRYDRDTGESWEENGAGASDSARLEAWADCGADAYRRAQVVAEEKKPKRMRRSKEAIRKAKARAEGRVKGYQRRGPASLATMIAATEASLATRRAKLAELKANPAWVIVSAGPVLRCEAGITKAEKALETYRQRLAAEKST